MTSSQLLDKSINTLIEQVLFKPDRPRFDERVENINRIEPVRISRAGTLGKSKKKTSEAIPADYIAVPTEAELDYYSMGLQLPDKAENLEKLYRDMVTTGKFDYELCYLLRKQEALSELQDWVKVVWTKRLLRLPLRILALQQRRRLRKHLARPDRARALRCH